MDCAEDISLFFLMGHEENIEDKTPSSLCAVSLPTHVLMNELLPLPPPPPPQVGEDAPWWRWYS